MRYCYRLRSLFTRKLEKIKLSNRLNQFPLYMHCGPFQRSGTSNQLAQQFERQFLPSYSTHQLYNSDQIVMSWPIVGNRIQSHRYAMGFGCLVSRHLHRHHVAVAMPHNRYSSISPLNATASTDIQLGHSHSLHAR